MIGNLIVAALFYPFLTALGSASLIYLVGRHLPCRYVFSLLAILPATAVGWVPLFGWPTPLPVHSFDKLMLLPILVLAAALWLVWWVARDGAVTRRHRAAAAVIFAAVCAWIAQPSLTFGQPPAFGLVLLSALAGWWSCGWCARDRCERDDDSKIVRSVRVLTMLFWVAIGLAGTMQFGAAVSMALAAGAIAMAIAGTSLVATLRPGFGGGLLPMVWLGGLLAAFMTLAVLFTRMPLLSFLLLALCPGGLALVDRLAVNRPSWLAGPWGAMTVQALACAPPALAATAWSRIDQGPLMY